MKMFAKWLVGFAAAMFLAVLGAKAMGAGVVNTAAGGVAFVFALFAAKFAMDAVVVAEAAA